MRTKHFYRLVANNGSARNGSGTDRRLRRFLLTSIMYLLCGSTFLRAQATDGEPVVLLKTAEWGQDWPLNAQTPVIEGQRTAAGCVAVACAIIMKYWEWPEAGQGYTRPYTSSANSWPVEIPPRDLEKPYDWSAMPMSYRTPGKYEDASRLVADIGALLKVNYKPGLLGSSSDGSCGFMVNNYFYKNTANWQYRRYHDNDEWYKMIRDELDAGRPIYYEASDGGTYGGHAFVIDGYDNKDRFHLNLGWWGGGNGWYSLDSLVIGGILADCGHQMYIGIEPDREIWTDVSEENRLKYMKDLMLHFEQERVVCFGKDCITIRNVQGTFVSLKVDGVEVPDIGWGVGGIIIHLHKYPGELYEITIRRGPYKKVLYFKYKKE